MARTLLPDLEVLASVAHHRSFGRAAADREVSVSLVSQTIKRLETQLGVSLLRRTTRSVSPTAAGAELLRQVEPGTLRINAPAPVAQFLLARLSALFIEQHPGVTVELCADAAKTDIIREGFDAGVRISRDLQKDMVAVRIGAAQRYAVAGAPAYFERRPPPSSPRELAAHECIQRRFPGGALQEWAFQMRGASPQIPTPRLVVNDALIGVNAAVAGGGLVYVHERYVQRELASGELVQVLQAWSPGIGAPYLYYPRQRFLSAALRAFVDFAKVQAARS
jgi:DNA-binding transcriptional LysR family regulator